MIDLHVHPLYHSDSERKKNYYYYYFFFYLSLIFLTYFELKLFIF